MKPQIPESVIRSLAVSFTGFVLGAGMAQNAFGTPTGATVTHGSAQFAMPNATTLEITNSANAIINWQSFNIGQGEITRFIQPSADSAVLNRVTGANPSELLGNLSSNGHVFLINPQGIVVGENAVIDVAGFVASTLNLSDEDFLNGRYNFQGENAGALINRGFITAGPGGEIALIAPQIENHGALSVDNGALLLAAGEKVTLTRFDLNGIEFEVQAPDNRVINLGELIARRGAVGVFAGSIDQRGIIEAGSLGLDAAGNIVLQARAAITVDSGARIAASGGDGGNIRIQALEGDTLVSGNVEAVGRDGTGGSIEILGERVGLTGQAEVDASGSHGGGEILIGGDYRGLNQEVQNASGTFVGEDVSLVADAAEEGDGGRVIVWADEATRMYGGISATGGSIGGDGGFIETSGKQYLEVGSHVPDVSAANGKAGEWLLDPHNITIQSAPGTIDTQSPNFLPVTDNSSILASVISAALTGGATVTIDTNSPSGTQAGNVTFNAPITAAGAGTLNVRADGDIVVNVGITANASGPLNIDFESNRDQGNGLGGIQFAPGIGINTNNGFARFIARGSLADGNGVVMNSASGAVNAGDGEILIQSQAGNIDLTGGTFSALLSNNKVTLEADGFDFTFGAISTSTGALPEVELRSFSTDVDFGPSVGGLQVDDALLGPINAGSLIIASAAGHDVRTGQEVVTLSVDTTINSGRNIFFNNTSLPGLLADDINLTLNAAGSIIDSNPGGIDIDASSASSLILQATQGIQAEVNVTSLRFDNSAGGAVDIVNRSADPVTMLLGGTNSGNGATTIDYASDIEIAGDISHGPGSLTIISTGIINDVGVNITGAGGGIRLLSANMTNNGVISDSGGVLIDTSGFTNGTTGVINNGGGAGDIVIHANSIDLIGGQIDAGALAKTILTPVDGAVWTLGDTGADLSETELNFIQNNIQVGIDDGSLLGVNVVGRVGLGNSQNLTIQPTGGTIVFNQNGDGIQTAGDVVLSGAGIVNGASGIDVVANRLTVNSTSGIDLETQLNELIALNDDGFGTATGSINIANSGSDLTIAAPGVRNVAAVGDIVITNTSGSLFVDGLIDAVDGDIGLTANAPGTDIIVKTDIVAAGDIALTAGRDLIVHAGPGPTTHARVRAGNTLNLSAGENLALISDTAVNEAAIVSDSASQGTQNGIELQAGDTLLVGATTSAGLLNMSGGTATFSDTAGLGGLTLSGGVLGGTGNVNVSGATVWSGGTMDGTGVTTANGGLDISGSLTLNRTLSNAGTGIWQGAGDIGGTGAFSNQTGASLDITNDQNMTVAFSNAGTVTKSSTGTTQFNTYTQTGGTTTLSGTVAIDTLALSGGVMDGTGAVIVPTVFNWTGGTLGGTGITTSTGSLLIDGAVTLNRTLDNNGGGVWQGTNNIGGTGTFNNLAAAVFDITNDQSMLAAFNNAGTVNKTSTGITQFLNYNQTGGASTFAGQVNADTLDLGGGLLDGNGDVDVATTFNWTGGTMAGGGTTTSNNSLLIDGAVTLDRTLSNAGNGTWQGAFDIAGAGAFNNLGGADLTIMNDQSMTVAFNNAGNVSKAGTGTTQFNGYTQISGVSTLAGTVNIDTLNLGGGMMGGDGDFNIATQFNWTGGVMGGAGTTTVNGGLLIDGAVTLDRTLINNGSGAWQGAGNIDGAGLFENSGLAVLSIDNNQNVNVAFDNAGAVNKTSTGTTLFSSYNQTGGTTTFAGTVGISTLNLSGGVLDGDGSVNVGAQLDWTGGTMSGTGTTTSNGNLLIDGAVTLDRTLNNTSNGVWSGANDINGGGVLNNAAGGVLRVDNDQVMSAAFNNAGVFNKTGAGITSFVAYHQTGGATRLNGGTLELTDGEFLMDGGVLTGHGTVAALAFNHAGGWIVPGDHGAASNVSNPTNYTPHYGTLIIDGDLQMGSAASVILDLGLSNERGGAPGTDFDFLDVTGHAQLNGMLTLFLDQSRFQSAVGETFQPVMRFSSQSGAFSSANVIPPGYAFSPTVLPQGLGLSVTAVPRRDTRLIPDDELERLRDEFRENIARLKLERERRRKQDEEEEKRRRALMCS